MPTAFSVVFLTTTFLAAGSAVAQPTPASAGQAAVRLVEAARARDWPALAAFVDPQTFAEVAAGFPATADAADEEIRALLAMIDPDRPTERPGASGESHLPAAGSEPQVALRLARWMRSLYGTGPLDGQTVMARVLALVALCDPNTPLSSFDGVGYAPVRVDVRPDGTVEAIGRLTATVGGEPIEGLAVTPLRWTEGRWTVDGGISAARDAELNPAADMLTLGALDWMYGMVAAFQADADGTVPGCSGGVE